MASSCKVPSSFASSNTCKLSSYFRYNLQVFEDAKEDGTLQLDAMDYGRRMAVERDIEGASSTETPPPCSNVIFDESGHFILFPTLLGVKVINIATNRLVRVLGRVENTERFLSIAMFQGVPTKNSQFARDKKRPKIMAENPKAEEEKVV